MKDKINVLVVCHDSLLYGASQSLLNWIDDIKEEESIYKFIFLLPTKHGELYKKLKERKHDVVTYKYYLPIWKFEKISASHLIKNILRLALSLVINPFTTIKIKKLCKSKKIDIIHSNSLSVVIGAKVAYESKIKHVWHAREYMEEDHMMSICYNKNKIAEYYANSYAIFISKAIEKKYNNRFKKDNKVVIYNKVEYDNNYNKTRKFLDNDICNIMIAGKLAPNKGQKEAILAINELNKKGINLRLYICGEGQYGEELKKLVKENNIENVEFLGFRNDLKKIRENMDIALVCSKSEAFGRVTVEAMYYENLVIGADTAATIELVQDGINGYLYKSGCFKSLANKIELAINNKYISELIIKNAKQDALNKYKDSIYIKIFNVYNTVLNRLENKMFN